MEQWPIRAVAEALEVIPRTLAQNCGGEVVRTVTALRAAHAAPGWRMDGDQLATDGNVNIGINGVTGKLADMADVGIWDTFQVKVQTIKTAVESAAMLLRIDDIVSGIGAKK
jgi:T-complex protein 1 subunit gamma